MSKPRVAAPEQQTGNIIRDSSLGLVPQTLDPYLELNKTIWYEGPLSAAEIELVRLRNARKVNCVYCKAARYDIATEAGLSEDKVAQIDDDYQDSNLSKRDKLLLEYTDHYLANPTGMSEDLKQRLKDTFTEAEIVHASTALLLFNSFSRGAVAFGGMPEEDLPLMPMAVPE